MNSAKISMLFLSFMIYLTNGKNCSRTSIGQLSLKDLGTGFYQAEQGGLFPNGSNIIPSDHENDGIWIANNKIYPRDSDGNLDTTNGKIIVLSIGMSNTNQEWNQFMTDAANNQDISDKIVFFNGAQGGIGLEKASDNLDSYNYWSNLVTKLETAGHDTNQVQVIWLKQAYGNPPSNQVFPEKRQTMRDDLVKVSRLIKTYFSNSWIIYTTSRIYGDYSDSINRQEPTAFGGGFGYKWLIEDQINEANTFLNYNPNKGTAHSPWITWGPYIWADGIIPTNDGLSWLCSDLDDDGHHPDTSAEEKISDLLMDHFTTHSSSIPWFLA